MFYPQRPARRGCGRYAVNGDGAFSPPKVRLRRAHLRPKKWPAVRPGRHPRGPLCIYMRKPSLHRAPYWEMGLCATLHLGRQYRTQRSAMRQGVRLSPHTRVLIKRPRLPRAHAHESRRSSLHADSRKYFPALVRQSIPPTLTLVTMQSYQNPKNVDQGWMASFLPYLSPGIPHAAASPWQATSRATKALSEAEKHKNHPAGFDESTPIDSSAMQLSSGTQWLDATPPTGRRLPRMPTPTPAPTPAPPLLSLEPAQAPPASSLKLPPQAAAALARQRNHTTTTPPRPPPTDRLVVPLDANPFSPLVYTPSSSGSSSRAITPQPGGAPTPQPVSTSKPVTSTTRRARQDGTRKKRARHSASRDYALAKDPVSCSSLRLSKA